MTLPCIFSPQYELSRSRIASSRVKSLGIAAEDAGGGGAPLALCEGGGGVDLPAEAGGDALD